MALEYHLYDMIRRTGHWCLLTSRLRDVSKDVEWPDRTTYRKPRNVCNLKSHERRLESISSSSKGQ